MNTNRRQFIKTAGTGIVGLGVLPALGGITQFLNPGEGAGFPRATPESQGISTQSIRQFLAAANDSGISWHSFMLLRHGNVVAEGWWKPYEPEFVHTLYSLSKSFTSTAIGLLVKEGKLDIHAKVASFFPGDLPANPSDNFQQMTVRSLLTMNTGHGEDTMPKMRASTDSWVKTYLAQPVEFAPGSHFLYNTGNTYMLGAILHQVTGETLENYLRPRLFEPLGIKGYDWETSPQGLNTAGYGLRVHTEDIAKLGQLYLQKGNWKGTSLLPASWVEEATSKQTESQVNNGDWSEGYGYQFWRCTHGFYRGDGAYGQYCIVMPELDAVLAVTSQTPDMQKSLKIIWEHLPPGMQAGVLPENSEDQSALKKELSALMLPVVKGAKTSTMSSRYHKKKWAVEANDLHVKSLEFSFSGKTCVLSVEADDQTSTLEFGWEEWRLNRPREMYIFRSGDMVPKPSRIAGTATWVNDHTLQLNLRFVEAIFGDALTCVFVENGLTVTFLNSVAETAVKKTVDPRKGLVGMLI
ncbi:MAG TPA: serine hydrolase [Puia sp.]|jgi:CubicO group peptidase (beta-lactamase class C family)|nr:serine hydrolase [Puia sp.]